MKAIHVLSVAAVTLLSACGGGGSNHTPAAPPAATRPANVQINLGDAPADRLLTAGVVVDSVTLSSSGGGTVSVSSGPRPIELMRLMGTVTPLSLAQVPPGTYTGVTLMLGAATVAHVDPSSGSVVRQTLPGGMSAHAAFDPPLVVGDAPMVVNIDMDVGASFSLGAAGNLSMHPVLTAVAHPLRPGSTHPEDGGLHGQVGWVDGMHANGFTLHATQGLPGVPMRTHAGTQFSGMSGMGMMSGTMLVAVDAMPQSDGSWLVHRVRAEMGAGSAMAAGVITGIVGAPPTQLTLAMHDGAGSGVTSSHHGAATVVSIDANTQFSIETIGVDLAGLPFTPAFDRAHLVQGQHIKALSSAQMTHGHGGMGEDHAVAGARIVLEPQGVRGTVAGYTANGSEATFELMLPADSAFARLTGKASVTVYRRAGSVVRGATPTNGSSVIVRGLLFIDGSALRMVAGRIVVAG
jgi:hypothetical protein